MGLCGKVLLKEICMIEPNKIQKFNRRASYLTPFLYHFTSLYAKLNMQAFLSLNYFYKIKNLSIEPQVSCSY